MIKRDYYLDKILPVKDTDYVKIITGIRRCGKSSMLKLYKEYLLEQANVDNKHIIEINYEQFQFDELRDPKKLHAYIGRRVAGEGKYYLFVDEIQELLEWARVINSIRVSFNIDIYVTGSNSRVFAGEHLTYLSGRYVEIKMFPLSFGEFKKFRGVADNSTAFNEYLRVGSFPAVSLASSEEQSEAISSGLFDSVFTRDILLRGKIKDEGRFFKVARFIADGVGSQLSANSIANTLKSQGYKISVDAVDNYISLMCKSYFLYSCNRYDIRGKEFLRSNSKLYVADTGLRNQLLGYKTGNIGHIVENLVFIELLRRGYDVSVGKLGDKEIDFVAIKGKEKIYIQVSLTALEENTLKRELAPFYLVKDNYRKILITADSIDLSVDGIEHINLYNFLSEIK